MNIKVFCRLCFNLKENMLNIFDRNGIELNISHILSKHFWFMVLDRDEFSKTICKECWNCVDEFNKFYNRVKDTYDKFIENQLEIKTEPVTNTYEVQCNTDDIGTVIQSSICTPEEKITFSSIGNNIDAIEKNSILPIKKRHINKPYELKLSEERIMYQEPNPICESHLEDVVERVIPGDADMSEIPLKHESDEFADKTKINTIEKDDELHTKFKNIPDDTDALNKCKKPKLKFKSNTEITKQNKVQLIEMDEKIRQYCCMECELCDYKFDTFLIAKQHYRNSHKINGYLRCCERKLSRRGRILDHIELHINPNAFRCDICDKSYVDKASIKSHLESHLPDTSRPYKCSECSKTFVMNCQLLQHKRLRHFRVEDKKFHCIHCDKSFLLNSLLTTHIRIVHECTYTQICDICAKVFKTKQALKDHLRQHIADDSVKLQCNICGAWLKHKHSLRRHIRNHQDSSQICPICNKESASKQALESHIRYVHRERKHPCTMCHKKFKKPRELQEHLATHTGENLYTCPYCPRTFKSNANMHSHRKKSHPVEWQQNRSRRVIPS